MADRQLEYIQTIAQCNSILKASEKLYVTPSALSKYVQKLESDLNIKLFDRVGKSFVLTHAGDRYLFWQKQINAIQNDMLSEMHDLSAARCGKIRIGVQLGGSYRLIREILPIFYQRCPQIEIELHESTSNALRRMLEENLLDFALIPDGELPTTLNTRFLAKNHRVLVVRKDSEVARLAVHADGFPYPWVDVRLLKESRFISPFPDQEAYAPYARLTQYSFHPNIVLRARSIATMLDCVEAGYGIIIGSDQIIYANRPSDSLALLSYGRDSDMDNIVVATRKDHYIDSAADILIECCLSVYEQH